MPPIDGQARLNVICLKVKVRSKDDLKENAGSTVCRQSGLEKIVRAPSETC